MAREIEAMALLRTADAARTQARLEAEAAKAKGLIDQAFPRAIGLEQRSAHLALRGAQMALQDGDVVEAAGYLRAAQAWLLMQGTCLLADPAEAMG